MWSIWRLILGGSVAIHSLMKESRPVRVEVEVAAGEFAESHLAGSIWAAEKPAWRLKGLG